MQCAFKLGMTISEFYDCTPRDLFNFLKAGSDKVAFDVEQNLDYVRHIMWASLAPNSKSTIRLSQIIPLKRDHVRIELTDYENQELRNWSDEQDKEMGLK